MREYELVFLIADAVTEDKQAVVINRVKKEITDAKGEIIAENDLGRRKLAYEIKKNEFASYCQINFRLEGNEVNQLEHEIRLIPEVIRHLLILQKAEHISILEEKVAAIADEDLEKVIGERSIEQVEGETEESYDLMAKRDKAASEESDSEKPSDAEKSVEPIKPAKVVSKDEKPMETEEVKTDRITKEKIVEEKRIKKTEKVTEEPKIKKPAKVKEEKPAKIVSDKTTEPKKTKISIDDEAERLKKLDDKLDEILGDDI